MVPYLLDFHGNIRFSKTVGKYQEQLYALKKITIAFLDPPKKMCVTFRRMFMEQSWNNPIFNIPRTLFRNNPQYSIGNFFRI